MNNPAAARPPARSRLALIVAGVLALLGSFVVTAPAQAGYYGDGYYGSNPCSYRCGGYVPYRPRCSSCGCYHRCGSRSGVVYERRYVEREYVERRYGYGGYGHGGYRPHYGYNSYGYRPRCGYNSCGGYRSYSRPYPWGYGGVRSWRGPYGGYEPSAGYYEESPRPPAPVLEGAGYEGDPYGY
jgi:hypothetical protein